MDSRTAKSLECFLHQTGQGVEMLGTAGSTQILPSGLSIAGGLHRQISALPAWLEEFAPKVRPLEGFRLSKHLAALEG